MRLVWSSIVMGINHLCSSLCFLFTEKNSCKPHPNPNQNTLKSALVEAKPELKSPLGGQNTHYIALLGAKAAITCLFGSQNS